MIEKNNQEKVVDKTFEIIKLLEEMIVPLPEGFEAKRNVPHAMSLYNVTMQALLSISAISQAITTIAAKQMLFKIKEFAEYEKNR